MGKIYNVFELLLSVFGALIVISSIEKNGINHILYAYLSIIFFILSYKNYKKQNKKELKIYTILFLINFFFYVTLLI